MWQVQSMQAGFFCLLCWALLLQSHHKSRQVTERISAWASYSMPWSPASCLSCAGSLALSFRHFTRSKGGFLVWFFPQISASLWKNWAHLCLAAGSQTFAATSHMLAVGFLQSHGNLVWGTKMENTWAGKYFLSSPLPTPPPLRARCHCLLPFPWPSIPPGHTGSWSRREPVVQEPPSSRGTTSCACCRSWLNCSQEEISISKWEIAIFRWHIRAPSLGAQLSPSKLEGKNPSPCTKKARQRVQGEEKW